MKDRLASPALDDPNLGEAFRRKLIRWTLSYWTFAFVFLTVRSVIRAADHLLVQAVLRIPMMAIGLAICAILAIFFVRIDKLAGSARLALIALAAVLATTAFSAGAYILYYRLPGLWAADQPLVAALARYMIEFIWIFAGWILLFHYVRFRVLASAQSRPFVRELWARERDGEVRIPIEQVEWIESESDYARVHAGGRSYLIRSTMRWMEASLDPDAFVRLHRRVIVARNALATVRRRPDGGMTAQLRSGTTVPVGRNYAKRLKSPGMLPSAP